MKSGKWTFITAVVVALIISGSAVFISFQYNKTQKDIANTQAQAQKDLAKQINEGLGDIGVGICQSRESASFRICTN